MNKISVIELTSSQEVCVSEFGGVFYVYFNDNNACQVRLGRDYGAQNEAGIKYVANTYRTRHQAELAARGLAQHFPDAKLVRIHD